VKEYVRYSLQIFSTNLLYIDMLFMPGNCFTTTLTNNLNFRTHVTIENNLKPLSESNFIYLYKDVIHIALNIFI